MITELRKPRRLTGFKQLLNNDIAQGLKQLLMDASFTIDLILDLGYREISEKLHIDSYVGKIIVDSARNIMQEKTPG